MMFQQWQKDALGNRLASFSPDRFPLERSTAIYAAAITLADSELQVACLNRLRELGIAAEPLYEVVLQSYLFLGFPRMLGAAEVFHRVIDRSMSARSGFEVGDRNVDEWFARGDRLCRNVYAHKYDPLRRKVSQMAPEVFEWMILEGYGKVLSRPALDIVSRETAIVACLMIEQHLPQLRAHVNGALNVGASVELVELVVEDLSDTAGEGAQYAMDAVRKAAQKQ